MDRYHSTDNDNAVNEGTSIMNTVHLIFVAIKLFKDFIENLTW